MHCHCSVRQSISQLLRGKTLMQLACCDRPDGLFPPDDHILAELAADPKAFPFEKHLAGKKSNHERLTRGGWTVGNAAARRGLDLRIFYKARCLLCAELGAGCEAPSWLQGP